MACDRPVDPPRCTSVGDGLLHLVAFDESLRDDLAAAVRASMAEDYDAPTRLRLIEQPRVTPLTDVIAFSGDYGDNGAAGWVYCPSDAPQGINRFDHRWCRHQELHLNHNPRLGLFFDDEASRATSPVTSWGTPSGCATGATRPRPTDPSAPPACTPTRRTGRRRSTRPTSITSTGTSSR